MIWLRVIGAVLILVVFVVVGRMVNLPTAPHREADLLLNFSAHRVICPS